MREILFRGQTRKRGEKVLAGSGEKLPGIWVYGGIFPQNKGGSYSIIYTYDPIDKKIVYADTVGQYTGLTDKSGVKIFEGDVLLFKFEQIGEQKAIVEYSAKAHSFLMRPINDFQFAMMDEGEVVGNIHDNPELLEEES